MKVQTKLLELFKLSGVDAVLKFKEKRKPYGEGDNLLIKNTKEKQFEVE